MRIHCAVIALAMCAVVSPAAAATPSRDVIPTRAPASTPGVAEVSSNALPSPADLDGDGIDDGLEQVLAERYAPVIYIHPSENNYPANVDWFLARAHLDYFEDCFPDVNEHVPGASSPLDSQAMLLGDPWAHPDAWGPGHPVRHCGDPPDHRRITTVEPDPESYSDQTTFLMPDLADQYKVGSLDPSDWKSYVHVYPNSFGGVTVQFWHNFAYNGLDFLGFGNHGGDWDGTIHVVLDAALQPLGAWYSRHSDDHPGTFFPWDQVHKYQVTHPLMILDRGGHAAFKDVADAEDHGVPGTDYTWSDDPDNLFWGTAWKTWTGGGVVQHDNAPFPVAQHLTQNPGTTGGVVNLGEYNPGVRQPTSLLAGQLLPLNHQEFLAYSGRWGSIGLIFSGPRGPVFQGYDGGVYKSWYNQASGAPANAASHPWREPPVSTLSVGPPTYTSGSVFVNGATPFSVSATSNAIATSFGSTRVYSRIYPAGSAPPAYLLYSAPFALSGPDGAYTLEYYAVDALNNVEPPHAASFILDTTPPVAAVAQPAAADYAHPDTLTLQYSVSDGAGAGVAAIVPLMDGSAALAGHGLASGQIIPLLTEMLVGSHTFSLQATDNLGNANTTSVTFQIIVTPASIKQDVTQLLSGGGIKKAQLTGALLAKLNAAAAAIARGDCGAATNIYQAFIKQVDAQRDKAIDGKSADILIADAQYLIDHCAALATAIANHAPGSPGVDDSPAGRPGNGGNGPGVIVGDAAAGPGQNAEGSVGGGVLPSWGGKTPALVAWPSPYREGNLNIAFAASMGTEERQDGGARIYDLSGRLVRSLSSVPYRSGYRLAIWDGNDVHGARVARGMYFVSARGPGRGTTLRVAVLR
jgi:hypothetical protein